MLKLCVITVVVAVAAAQGGFMMPKACADERDEAKQCFEIALIEAGVDFEMNDVHECFKKCPALGGKGDGQMAGKGRGQMAGKGDGQMAGKGRGQMAGKGDSQIAGKGRGQMAGRGAGKGGNGGRGPFPEMHECVKGEIGDTMKSCVDDKVDFELVEREDRDYGFGGGKGRGAGQGRGGRKRGFFDRASCSEEVEQCVRGIVGDWFDKQDELKRVLCDAGENCWTGHSDECKTQRGELKDAMCACKEEHKTEIEAAFNKCAADFPSFGGRHFAKGMDRLCKESPNDENDAFRQRGPYNRFCNDDATAEDDDAE